VHAVLPQHALEREAVELPGRPPEGRVVENLFAQRGVARGESEAMRLQVEQRAGDHLLQGLFDQAHLARLLGGDSVAELGLQALYGTVEVVGELDLGDLDVADGGHGRVRSTAENVADTPHGKAQYQEAKQNLDHPGAGALPHRVQHAVTRFPWKKSGPPWSGAAVRGTGGACGR